MTTLFENEADARRQCAALNQAGGFYRVADLLKEDVFDLRGEVGFAVLWDYTASAEWRGSYLRVNFAGSVPPSSLPEPQPAA